MTAETDARETDARWMAAALALSRRGLGRVWPNPAVGCLVVRDTPDGPALVGRGWTGEGGRPHAETVALEAAGEAARGSTAYVTLEPCAHHGRTPPCAEALIAAGITRVVSALEDPDPRVSGQGHRRLREAGIALDIGCGAEAARRLNAGFISKVERGRPHVLLKLAVSADGKISARPGARTAISGEAANARVHMMRALSDAILVGAGTWAADDPELTCRLPGLAARSPVRVILDRQAALPPASRLVATMRTAPLWVVVGEGAEAAGREGLAAAGAEILPLPVDADGRFDLQRVLDLLAGRGITRLMVEGGAAVAQSLLAGGLVDELALIEAPHEIGEGGLAAPSALGAATGPGGQLALVSEDRLGPDTLRMFESV